MLLEHLIEHNYRYKELPMMFSLPTSIGEVTYVLFMEVYDLFMLSTL
jgi:hypothetical protein